MNPRILDIRALQKMNADEFLSTLNQNRSSVVLAISNHYQLPFETVSRLVDLDEKNQYEITRSDVMRRADTLQTKVLNRYTVIEKNRRTLRLLAQAFSNLSGRAFLDVGCGMGVTMVDARTVGFTYADGLEIDSAFHERSIIVCEGFRDSNVRTYLSDFLAHSFDRKYDLITFFDVFEHIADHIEALEKARSLLTEDGIIFIYQGNYRSGEIVRTEPHYRVPGLSLLPFDAQVSILTRMNKIKDVSDFVVNRWPTLDVFSQADGLDCYLNTSGANLRGERPHQSPSETLRHLRGISRAEHVWVFPGVELMTPAEIAELKDSIEGAAISLKELIDSGQDMRAYTDFAIGSWEMVLTKPGRVLDLQGFSRID